MSFVLISITNFFFSETMLIFEQSNEKNEKKTPFCYHFITTIIFVASLSMCIYQTYLLIVLYLSDPIETQMKVQVHDTMKFPAVTICNLNPVRRSRWQIKNNKTESREPQASPLTQQSTSQLNSKRRLMRSLIEDDINELQKHIRTSRGEYDTLKRTKRQLSFFAEMRRLQIDVTMLSERVDQIEALVQNHINSTSHNQTVVQTMVKTTTSALVTSPTTLSPHPTVNLSSLWANITENRYRQTELEGKMNDLEARLSITELTSAEIVEEMERTKSYLNDLKANISKVDQTVKNDTVTTVATEDGEEKLPPSKDLEAFQNYLKDIGEITRDDLQQLGNQKEDFIATCAWQGTICDSSHFETFQNFMYGNCFTFNTSKVGSHVSGTGPYNGLSLSLFIEQDEYMDRIASAAGARVVIHESHFKPLPDEEGFFVAPGYTTAIAIHKETTVTVKPICDPDIETSGQNNQRYLYSQKGCLNKCLSDEIIRKCHCAGTQFLLDSERTCSVQNASEVECTERLASLARQNKLPSCYCPMSCMFRVTSLLEWRSTLNRDTVFGVSSLFTVCVRIKLGSRYVTTSYIPVISSATWPSEKYLPSLLEELVRVRHKVLDLFENITDFSQYFRKNFLRINIFFQELKEQELLQRHAYGIASLLSDIGGQLGLWVGVSVFTLVDFTETMSKLFMSVYNRMKGKLSRTSQRLSISKDTTSRNLREYSLNRKSNLSMGAAGPSPSGSINSLNIELNASPSIHVNFEDS